MTIPGVGRLTALTFVTAIDDPSRFRRSRHVRAYLGLVPRRYQSGEIDYTGGISKCGDGRLRTLLYEAANVILTRYRGSLALKNWALDIARRSTMRNPPHDGARIARGCCACIQSAAACALLAAMKMARGSLFKSSSHGAI